MITFILETAVQDAKVMQDFESESLLMGAIISQKMKASEKIQIPRALVIAFSSQWATNLCSQTRDQTEPIILIKADEKLAPTYPRDY